MKPTKSWLIWIVPIIAYSLPIYRSFFGFDITDEGYLFYLLKTGKSALFMSPYHTLIHPIGALFNHQLLAYRLLGITCVGLTASIVGLLLWKLRPDTASRLKICSLAAVLIAVSPVAFSRFTTLSYNHLATLSAAIWLFCTLLSCHSTKEKQIPLYYSLLLSIAIGLALYARPPFGIALIPLTYATLFFGTNAANKRHIIGLFTLILGGILGLIRLHMGHELSAIIELYHIQLGASHSHMGPDIQETVLYWCQQALVGTLIWWAWLRHPTEKKTQFGVTLLLVITGVIWIQHGVLSFGEMQLTHTLRLIATAIPIAYALVMISKRHSHAQKWMPHVLTLTLPLVIAQLSVFGTNCGMTWHTSIYALPLLLLPLMYTLLHAHPSKTNQYLIIGIASILVVGVAQGIVVNNLIQTYREAPSSQLTTQSRTSPYLKHIRLTPELASLIDTLNTTLENVSTTNTAIFAYPDLPGLIVASPLSAYGSAFNPIQPNGDKAIMTFIKLCDTSTIHQIYILTRLPLPRTLSEPITTTYRPTSDTHQTAIQTAFYHFNPNQPTLITLAGPYTKK